MDHGPVDAAPTGDDFDDPNARADSPDDTRLNLPGRRGLRSSSQRRKGANGNDTASDHHRSRSRRPSISSESAGTIQDVPLYQRVGATTVHAEDEMPGVDDADGPNIHLTETLNEGELPPTPAESDGRLHRMVRFTLYETNARYWITGGDLTDTYFRLLRIDRTSPPGQIALFEDETVYDRSQMNAVLMSIDEGNRPTGGLKMRYSFWGLLGFIRFTEAYYMQVITKRQQVAMIGGHYVYQIEATDLVPLTTGASTRFMRDRNPEELRFLGILGNLDLTKSFYFSHSYDVTHSLQQNIVRQRAALNEGLRRPPPDFNAMYVWNHHLLKPAQLALKHPFDWCLPIIHGFIAQAALDIFGRSVYITIIGRRSRFFAGARFLKRGVNDQGFVANDVETEQIVAEKLTTSFHAPGPRLYSSPTYTSYLHHRGSIPLYWTQDNSGVTPKPDIDLNLNDPFYQPAALHFDNLFERYGCPVYVLNLIKQRERTPRESKLLTAFEDCVKYLNQSLPEDKKVQYKAFDMSRASKTRGGDVIGSLEVIADEVVSKTGFFHNGGNDLEEPQVQSGVARTNCIDCLDRTNAAQFVIGKRAFALQLKALGVFDKQDVDYDTDAVNIFTHMFHDHGDTIAVQYGGSHLVNTMATYRKLNHWQSQSRDMVESFKRYYHNSFLDSQRQEAYNLFLGNYVWAQGQPFLWDLPTDYYLHHSDPRAWLERPRRSYIYWYTPEFLEPRSLPPEPSLSRAEYARVDEIAEYDDYWLECYRPAALSSLNKVYSYRVNADHRYLPERPHLRDHRYDMSPFVPRLDPHRHSIDSTDKRPPPPTRKGVKIVDPQDTTRPGTPSTFAPTDEASLPTLTASTTTTNPGKPTSFDEKPGILKDFPRPTADGLTAEKKPTPVEKAQLHLLSLNQIHAQSLAPEVSEEMAKEYEKYMAHPLTLPLVVSSELSSDAYIDYVEYIHKFAGANLEDEEPDEDGEMGGGGATRVSEQDLQHFLEFLDVRSEPLTVQEEDLGKKRYKAYRQWLRGKSLFKQSKVDPEYKAGT